MSETMKAHLAVACRRLLRPLVRVLLRHGMAYGEFAEIVKTVYVEVAREDFTPGGRKPTDSRVAILTGLTRKDVKRLREALSESSLEVVGNVNRATRVLSGWYQDSHFAGADGLPLELPMDGTGPSFAELVRRYSGDMPPRAMLEELERVGAVQRCADDRLRVLNRTYVPGHGDPEGLRMLGQALRDLGSTIDHNIDPERETPPFVQRMVANDRVPLSERPLLRRLAAEHGQQLLEMLDDWLSAHEVEADDTTDCGRVGVGIYYFEEDPDRSR